MALDARYVTDGPLEEIFLDKTSGLPLAGGTLTFYRDSARTTAKSVYQLSGTPPNYTYTALPNPITLSSVGTVQNAGGDNVVIYYYPYDDEGNLDLYYVVVDSAAATEQFTREAWPNSVEQQSSVTNSLPVQNEISNPQFSKVFMQNGLSSTFTLTGSLVEAKIAPDWDLVMNGTGTVAIQQIAIAGSQSVETTPPYSVIITVSSGVTTCYLRQRFNSNSGLWASTANNQTFLSSSIVAKNVSGTTVALNMYYQDSNNNAPINILAASVISGGGYKVYTGSSVNPIDASLDPHTGTAGYVEIQVWLPQASQLELTSIQVVPTFDADAAIIPLYSETSSNRELAYMGDYYLPRLSSKPIPSLLTAWDFPLNPQQLPVVTSLSTSLQYVWDQTICSISSGATVTVGPNAITGELKFVPTTVAAGAISVMQYLSGDQVLKMYNTKLSVNINAYTIANSAAITAQAFLYVAPSTSVIPPALAAFGTLSTSGTLASLPAGWTVVAQSGPLAIGTLNVGIYSDASLDLGFNGWQLSTTQTTSTTESTLFAMVVTFSWPAGATTTNINVNSISLVPGDIPTRPAPQTTDQVLRECQYYYEKSYDIGTLPVAANAPGPLFFSQGFGPTPAAGFYIATRSFGFEFKNIKRAIPTIRLYSTVTGAIDNVSFYAYEAGTIRATYPYDQATTAWTQQLNGHSAVYYLSNLNASVETSATAYTGTKESFITAHYIADAKLGVVV